MAFLVKPVNGETQRMELVHIREALKNGIIAENWLVRDERQDFWYSVGKLVGKVTSQPVVFFCRKCLGSIRARRIDIGLPVNCEKCRAQAIVPDPEENERRLRDEGRMQVAKRKAIAGGLALGLGIFVTGLSYISRDKSGGWVLLWEPLAFGFGTFVVCFPEYLELKRKLSKRPPEPKND